VTSLAASAAIVRSGTVTALRVRLKRGVLLVRGGQEVLQSCVAELVDRPRGAQDASPSCVFEEVHHARGPAARTVHQDEGYIRRQKKLTLVLVFRGYATAC
jgi:hypothetical protein